MNAQRLVYGIGINDVPNCEIHIRKSWNRIFYRCYSEYHLSKSPTYKGCTVDPEWHYLSNYRNWYLQQGDVSNKHLDKDIIYPGNKVYGPDTCVFVSPELNTLLTRRNADRGQYPIGVSYNKRHKKFETRMSYYSNNKVKKLFLGYHTDLQYASEVYVNAKIKYLQENYIQKEESIKIVNGLKRWVEVLRNGEYDSV
jgi:hypothetical protein